MPILDPNTVECISRSADQTRRFGMRLGGLLKPGDLVKDETGLYGDIIFEVESVDHGRRTIRTSFEMLGVSAHLELNADSVTKVETK